MERRRHVRDGEGEACEGWRKNVRGVCVGEGVCVQRGR